MKKTAITLDNQAELIMRFARHDFAGMEGLTDSAIIRAALDAFSDLSEAKQRLLLQSVLLRRWGR